MRRSATAGARCNSRRMRIAAPIMTTADVLNALAAAYAETGRFPEAVDTAERALAVARADGNRPHCSRRCPHGLPSIAPGSRCASGGRACA